MQSYDNLLSLKQYAVIIIMMICGIFPSAAQEVVGCKVVRGRVVEVAAGKGIAKDTLRFGSGGYGKTLREVVVRPGKVKYSKRDNPAVALQKRLRKEKKLRDPATNNFYGRRRYEKLVFGASFYNEKKAQMSLPRKFSFLTEYCDTDIFTGFPVVMLSLKENSSRVVNKRGRSAEVVVDSTREAGIDKNFDQRNIWTILADVARDIDIYDDDVKFMQNRFVSPLSHIGPNYYKYFLGDTVEIRGRECAELIFVPYNPESFGFNGRMFVPTGDSAVYVRRVEMRMPHAINVNYLDEFSLTQDYELDSLGFRHKLNEDIVIAGKIMPATPRLYAKKHVAFDDFSYNLAEFDASMNQYMEEEGELFWDRVRTPALAGYEIEMEHLYDRMHEIKMVRIVEGMLERMVKGYVGTSNKSKFDIGPLNTMFSTNSIEGIRLRLGAMTTANLSRRWFGRAYVAYGTRDGKFKYGAEMEYSFIDKKYHSREFPMHALRLSYSYDMDWIGQHYLFTNADNVFLSWKRISDKKATYRKLSKLEYILENRSGFSLNVALRHEKQSATRWLAFRRSDGTYDNSFIQAGVRVELRYAPGEVFYQMASMRIPINLDSPVVMLSHEFGPKGFLGADFTISKTEVSAQKRFWFSAFGYLDVILKGAKIWSKVPYIALCWQNANLSYTIQPESYSLLNPMEFAMDYYASWDATYWLNGLIFNRIPIVNKLKLREVVSFKGFYGGLTKKNNPAFNDALYRFPEDAEVGTLGRKPYMEMSVGLDNILTILRVDYVWRLSYRDKPGVSNRGVRIALHFTF